MGKSKNKKRKIDKSNPTGVPSVRECELEITEDGENVFTGSVSGIIEKLQSTSPDERQCGCTTVAVIVSQKGAIDLLMTDHVVKILGPLMLDPSLFVQQAAVGALRNLSAEGAHAVCDRMVQEDVMTPLVAFLNQYGADWSPDKDSASNVVNPKNDAFLQAIHLLLNVCESNETAVKIANRENLVRIIITSLNMEKYGLTLTIAVAQCLLVLSENNPEASQIIKSEAEGVMLKIVSDDSEDSTMEHMLLKSYIAGILYNVTGGRLAEVNGTVLSIIVKLLTSIFEIETTAKLHQAVEKINQIQVGNGSLEETDHMPDVTEKDVDQIIVSVNNILAAQMIALEVATNLCSSGDEDEDEEWEDEDDNSGEELVEDVEMDNGDDEMNSQLNPLCVPSEVLSLFTSNNVLDHVLRLCASRDSSIIKSVLSYPSGKKLRRRLIDCQCHALLCVNNMVTSLPPDALGDDKKLYPVWVELTKLATTDALENLELMEASTSAMRAVIEVLSQMNSKEFHNVTENDLVFLYDMGLQCPHAQVRVNTLRIASAIGCILAKDPNPHPLLKAIGNFLLEIATKDVALWVVAEALDALFDVFAEDHTDLIAKDINMVARLKQIAPALKAKAHAQKKKLGEHSAIVSTARTNLIRFIKYKNG